MNLKCIISYAGTRYLGFQRTKMGPSIEAEMQKILEQILQHPVTLQAASRTDRGVHAEGQICNFFTEKQIDPEKLRASFHRLLPSDISILKLEIAPNSFHPTLDAMGKEYHYFLCNHPTQLPLHREFSWHVPLPLDLEKMKKGALLIKGQRDFSALSNILYKDPVRCVENITLTPFSEHRYLISVMGNNFLYKMVRNIIGTLVHIGQGKIPLSDLPSILESRDRRLTGMTAPAHGLCLKRVFY